MNLENISFKAKEVIQFGVYLISLTVFFLSMSAKVDSISNTITELQNEKKESKTEDNITQNEIKALLIRAELNRQNIEIIQADIKMLKQQYNELSNR